MLKMPLTFTKKIAIGLFFFSLLLFSLLILLKVNFDRQAVFLCQAVSNDPVLTMEECPAHKDGTSWILMVAFGITFLIFSSGIYLWLVSPKEVNSNGGGIVIKPIVEIDTSRFNEEELMIYASLQENHGSMYQSDLIKKTGMTKVKITRVLDKLEHEDKIVERKRRGMTNLVVLK